METKTNLRFSDYVNGGPLFALTLADVDNLDPLRERPLQMWVDGAAYDTLITSKRQLRKILRESKAAR